MGASSERGLNETRSSIYLSATAWDIFFFLLLPRLFPEAWSGGHVPRAEALSPPVARMCDWTSACPSVPCQSLNGAKRRCSTSEGHRVPALSSSEGAMCD